MDKREILISLFAAAAFTALLAHGFKSVRAAMPAGGAATARTSLAAAAPHGLMVTDGKRSNGDGQACTDVPRR